MRGIGVWYFALTLSLLMKCAHWSTENGEASYYANLFEGRKTASGEIFSQHKFTAAHPTLPFDSMVKVTNLENGKSVLVRINDRGPFVKDRIIDLSKIAADSLGFIEDGTTMVELKYLAPNQEN